MARRIGFSDEKPATTKRRNRRDARAFDDAPRAQTDLQTDLTGSEAARPAAPATHSAPPSEALSPADAERRALAERIAARRPMSLLEQAFTVLVAFAIATVGVLIAAVNADMAYNQVIDAAPGPFGAYEALQVFWINASDLAGLATLAFGGWWLATLLRFGHYQRLKRLGAPFKTRALWLARKTATGWALLVGAGATLAVGATAATLISPPPHDDDAYRQLASAITLIWAGLVGYGWWRIAHWRAEKAQASLLATTDGASPTSTPARGARRREERPLWLEPGRAQAPRNRRSFPPTPPRPNPPSLSRLGLPSVFSSLIALAIVCAIGGAAARIAQGEHTDFFGPVPTAATLEQALTLAWFSATALARLLTPVFLVVVLFAVDAASIAQRVAPRTDLNRRLPWIAANILTEFALVCSALLLVAPLATAVLLIQSAAAAPDTLITELSRTPTIAASALLFAAWWLVERRRRAVMIAKLVRIAHGG